MKIKNIKIRMEAENGITLSISDVASIDVLTLNGERRTYSTQESVTVASHEEVTAIPAQNEPDAEVPKDLGESE